MITMDVKGITWVGNIYQKFENMCLEAEDMMYEDTVKYIENLMKTVGESVKRLYSDVMQDLLSPSSCDLDEKVTSEWPIDQYADAGFCKKPFQGFKEIPVKADTKQMTEDSRVDRDVDNDATHAASYDGTCETDASFMSASRNPVKGSNFIAHSRQYVGSMDIRSNLGIDKNQANKKMAATQVSNEITLAETDTCTTSQLCELPNENESQNQNHKESVSKPASAKVTQLASVGDCCNEIENASTEHFPCAPVLVKPAEEKHMNTSSSSSGVLFGETHGFSLDTTIQSDDCSYSIVVLSHPEVSDTRSSDATNIDTVIEQGHKTVQQGHLKLEETCVMVTGEELQLVPKAGDNLKTSKKKRRQAFSLSKKSERRQEYKELAVWHRNSEKVKGDCLENLDPTLLEDHKKILLPSMSEPEWELL